MNLKGKDKINLIKEISKLRNRVMELEEVASKRKQIEDALRESETQLRLILNSLGDAIHVVDEDIHFVMMNTTFQRWNLELGLEIDVIGKDLFEVFPFLPKSVREEYITVFKSGETLRTEEKNKLGEREFITETRKIPVYENGEVSKIITIVRDITKRKLSDEALRESEERFRGIAEGSFDIIFIIDVEGNLSYISPAVERITGYAQKDILGKKLEKFLPESQLKRIKQASELLLKGESLKSMELEILGRNKNTLYLEINATPIFKKDILIGYQGIGRDITGRKLREEDMKKRLLNFRLEEGKVYLLEESSQLISHEILRDLLKIGYTGMIITRTYKPNYEQSFKNKIDFLWLSENGKKNAIKPKLAIIFNHISKQNYKKVIHIDRLDYLISKNGFKKVLEFVQNLLEFAIFSNNIVIISIDPTTLKPRELRLLQKETNEIVPMLKPQLPEDFNEILKFVFEQNMMGLKPSYSEVEHGLGVCKPTMRKRLRKLISSGYLNENIKGRSKVVELSDRGKNIFQFNK
jgi:PAS domain S-box-containing protein